MKLTEITTEKELSNVLRIKESFLQKVIIYNSVELFNIDTFLQRNQEATISGEENIKYYGENSFGLIEKMQIPKKNRKKGFRVVYKVYSNELSTILKILEVQLKDIFKPSNCIHGFVKGRNIRSNAIAHLGKKYLLSVDIKNFFETIDKNMIRNSFIKLGISSTIIEYLLNLVTYNEKLVQGYNTSPIIANIVFTLIDDKIRDSLNQSITYTRYADDLYFSSDAIIPPKEDLIELIEACGFKINKDKVKLMRRGQSQYVTGLSVFDNQHPRINKKTKRNLRLEIYYIEKNGLYNHVLEKHVRLEQIDLIPSSEINEEAIRIIRRISGWIFFINSIEPNLAKKLKKDFSHALSQPINRSFKSYLAKNESYLNKED